VLKFTFMRGYTLRLASDQPIEAPMLAEDPTACTLRLIEQAPDDEWFYGQAFPPGRTVWERLTQTFVQAANSMLLEEQPDGPIFPSEVIDHVLRAGYMGGHVDEWFQLRPMYRDKLTDDGPTDPDYEHHGSSGAMAGERAPTSEWSPDLLAPAVGDLPRVGS
jgi:hypothetical protein